MSDLVLTYNQLSKTARRRLLPFADMLLLQQKTRKNGANLAGWKENIKNVSTWTNDDIV